MFYWCGILHNSTHYLIVSKSMRMGQEHFYVSPILRFDCIVIKSRIFKDYRMWCFFFYIFYIVVPVPPWCDCRTHADSATCGDLFCNEVCRVFGRASFTWCIGQRHTLCRLYAIYREDITLFFSIITQKSIALGCGPSKQNQGHSFLQSVANQISGGEKKSNLPWYPNASDSVSNQVVFAPDEKSFKSLFYNLM